MPVITPLAIGGTIALGSAISSQVRKSKAEKALRNMPDPRYSATPQTLSFYDQAVRESIAPRGMSEQEKGAAFQDIAGITTGNIRNARRLGGGNISGQINASLNNAAVIGATQYGRQDAMLRSQNRMNAYNRLGNITNVLQGLRNNNTGLDVQKQIALGTAVRDARMERDQAIQRIGSAPGMGSGGGFGGGGKMGQTQPAAGAPTMGSTSMGTEVQFTDYKPNAFNPYTFGFNSTGYTQAKPQQEEQFVTTPYQPYGNEVSFTPYNSRRLGFND